MKKMFAILVVIVLSGCTQSKGAAELKQSNTFKGNTVKLATVLSPLTLLARVTYFEVLKDLQDNGYFLDDEKETTSCDNSCDL